MAYKQYFAKDRQIKELSFLLIPRGLDEKYFRIFP